MNCIVFSLMFLSLFWCNFSKIDDGPCYYCDDSKNIFRIMSSNVSIVNIYNGKESLGGLVFKIDVDGPINSTIEMARNKNGKHVGNGISDASNKRTSWR